MRDSVRAVGVGDDGTVVMNLPGRLSFIGGDFRDDIREYVGGDEVLAAIDAGTRKPANAGYYVRVTLVTELLDAQLDVLAFYADLCRRFSSSAMRSPDQPVTRSTYLAARTVARRVDLARALLGGQSA